MYQLCTVRNTFLHDKKGESLQQRQSEQNPLLSVLQSSGIPVLSEEQGKEKKSKRIP